MVTKKIVINHGDEHRAKIEKNFKETDFFFESYQRAAKCVSEIVNDALGYIEVYDENNNGHAFYDYGNNIVAFCAERGQGKTSAMLSFSGELERLGGGKDKKDNSIINFDFKKEGCFFEVLESIDPTMINDGVSVLKVFLSRLFYHFQAWLDNRNNKSKDFELSNHYQKMLSCFKKCYTNIEYLQDDRNNKEWNLNDLDMLSQIGDSSNLKNNIYNLVSLYFEITHEKKKDDCFLVVQIDDADLAIGNASDICEYVRRFLKVPRIIVLMAADYEQLKYVFSQKYHKEYERLIKDNPSFSAKCEKMASKYLEKILPHSHRVELPKLQNVIGEDHTGLMVEYNWNGDCRFEDEFSGCKDIQEQLIKLIYLRTGIILLKSEGKMHPCLPRRLRELTHLIRLLSDMEPVDHNRIFELSESDEERIRMIEMLKRNLQIFKSYFMCDWCVNRLSQSEQELIFKINEIKINESVDGEDDPQIYRILSEYLKRDYSEIDKKERTHKNIIKDLVVDGLSDRPELQSALFLYYSIYLNIRFSHAFENEAEYQRIMEWLDYPIEVPLKLRNIKYGKQYYVPYFRFNYENVKAKLKENEAVSKQRKWIELFCRAKPDENFNAPESLFISVQVDNKEVVEFNEELKSAEFDLLQPLNVLFYKGFLQEWRREVSKKTIQPGDSLVDIAPGKGENLVRENLKIAAVHRTVKNLIANYDVQNCLLNFIEKEYRYAYLKKMPASWSTGCLNIYEDMDLKCNEVFGFLNAKSNFQIVFEKFFDVPNVYSLVFLSNQDNKDAYLAEYKEKLVEAEEKVSDALELFETISVDELTGKFSEQEKRSLIDLDFLGDHRSEVAAIDDNVKNLWDKEQQIIHIYDPMLNAIEEGMEEVEKVRKSIPEYKKSLNINRSLL